MSEDGSGKRNKELRHYDEAGVRPVAEALDGALDVGSRTNGSGDFTGLGR
jgi:hypothetical protein